MTPLGRWKNISLCGQAKNEFFSASPNQQAKSVKQKTYEAFDEGVLDTDKSKTGSHLILDLRHRPFII